MGPQNDRRLLRPIFHIVGASCDREDGTMTVRFFNPSATFL